MTFYQKCIPHHYDVSIFDIDYETLKKQGIHALFFDLDNTIIGYDQEHLDDEHRALITSLQKDFFVVILSNTSLSRVSKALEGLDVPYLFHATKPLKRGFRKALKISKTTIHETVMIGDQLMTDVFGANRMGIKTILIRSVKRKSDRWMTKINRVFERFVLKQVQKKYPSLYLERLKDYVDDHEM